MFFFHPILKIDTKLFFNNDNSEESSNLVQFLQYVRTTTGVKTE